ncbi:MAG: CHAT domain-containing protein [Anaeromyxobacteraceae bacterium]
MPSTARLLLLALCAPAAALAAEPPRPLVPGTPTELALRGGEALDVPVELEGGRRVEVEVDVADTDPSAVLLDPGGRELARVALAEGELGGTARLVLAATTGAAGRHVLRLASPSKAGWVARARVTVSVRAPSPADAARDEARRIRVEAARLARDPAQRRAALERYGAALERLAGTGDDAALALTQASMAGLAYKLQDLPQAGERYAAAAARFHAAGRRRDEGRARSEVGLVAYARYDYPLTEQAYAEALAIHRETGDVFYEAETLNRMGWLRNAQGDTRAALALHERALPLRREAGSVEGEGVTWNDLGRAHLDLGDVDQALEALERGLALRDRDEDPGGAAQVLNRIGMARRVAGEFQPALDAFREAIPLARKAGDVRNQGTLMHNVATLLAQVGEVAESRRLLEEALAHCRGIKFTACESACLGALGVSYAGTREAGPARDALEKALAIRVEVKDAPGQASVHRALAEVHLLEGDRDAALASAEEALRRYRALGGLRVEGIAWSTLAQVRLARGELDEAEAALAEALPRVRSARDAPAEAAALALSGRLRAARGDLAGARALLLEGLERAESLRAGLLQVELRTSFLARQQDRYDELVDVLMALERAEPGRGHAAEALTVTERGRARGLLDLLSEARVDLGEGADAGPAARERALRRALSAKAAAQARLLAGKNGEARAAEAERELVALAGQWREAAAEVRRASPGYAALRLPEPLEAPQIQALVDEGTVLLEFALGAKRSWVFAVTPAAIEGFELPPRDAVEPAARRLVELLTARQRTGAGPQTRRAEAALDDAAAGLSRLLLDPLAARLRGPWKGRRLALVTSGALEYVPFAVLPEPGGRRTPLVASRELVRTPSASALAALRREAAARPRAPHLLAVLADPVFEKADPRLRAGAAPAAAEARPLANATREGFARLPYSGEEATAITRAAPPGAVLEALGFDASRETATGPALSSYRIVHFATHGVVDAGHPERSGVVLSLVDRGGAPRDGFLRLPDIYRLKLGADLVVLSGCQTALGQEVRGEGLVGLTRGFMYAGAPRVVASLWQVDDVATAELMGRFYRAMLKDGLRPAAALRRAQLELRRERAYASPFYWAAFVLEGEWR